jgi:hypothetical protein
VIAQANHVGWMSMRHEEDALYFLASDILVVQGTQFTCFTGTKVQILTQKAASSAHEGLPQNLGFRV